MRRGARRVAIRAGGTHLGCGATMPRVNWGSVTAALPSSPPRALDAPKKRGRRWPPGARAPRSPFKRGAARFGNGATGEGKKSGAPSGRTSPGVHAFSSHVAVGDGFRLWK